MHAAHLIIFQGHEIVVDVFVPCIFFHPGFKLFMIKYLSTVFQDKGVPTKQWKNSTYSLGTLLEINKSKQNY